MAIISTSIDTDLQLTVQTVTGEVTADEIIHAVKNYYEGVSIKFILWDFSRASLNTIASHQVGKLTEITIQYAERRKGGKTALVFSDNTSFGLGRMFDIMQDIHKSDVSHATFRSREAAIQWLRE